MALDYVGLAATVSEVLVEFAAGAVATISRTTPAQYDPETGTSAPESVTTQTVTAVADNYDIRLIDGTLIQRGDQQVFMSAKDPIQPMIGDKFIWAGVEYNVIGVTPISPNGLVTLLYELQVRR